LAAYNVSAVTGGSDALGDVVVQLDVGGRLFTGRGVASDVVEASARAYLAAVNRSVRAVPGNGGGETAGAAAAQNGGAAE
jgi:2-isopropylmalate synthase